MFDGGVISFYTVSNTAKKGQMPTRTYTAKASVCYERRSVGINRYAVALQNDAQIEWVCRTPALYDISTDEVAVLHPYSHEDNSVYKVFQIQQTQDEDGLPCTDFSLTRYGGLNANEVINN